MIYHNNKEIIDWKFDANQINKIYYNENVIFGKIDVIPPQDYSVQYLTFLIQSSGTISFVGSDKTNRISYSTDSGNTWSTESNNVTVNVNSGDMVLWKGEMIPQGYAVGVGKFSGTSNYEVQGNIMSMEYGDNFINQTNFNSNTGYDFFQLFSGNNITNAENLILPATSLTESCYNQLFSNCTSLTTAPQLPSTILDTSCYSHMFDGCTSLTTAPQLPSTTLAQNCYSSMFDGCTSLTQAPQLPATTLVNACYYRMFYGCSNLNYIKMLATDISASSCLGNWVNDVASTGTFVKHPSMTSLPSGVSGIPNGWTVEDA